MGGTREEPRDEGVHRPAVDFEGRTGLDDPPVAHDADALAHGHRLDLVVGDVQDGASEPPVDLDELGAHRGAELRVQVGERLVEQEGDGVAHERTAERHPLLLAAGLSSRGRRPSSPSIPSIVAVPLIRRSISAASTRRSFRPKARLPATVMWG